MQANRGRKRRATLWRAPDVVPSVESIKRAFVQHVQTSLGRDEYSSSDWDRYQAICLSARDHLITRWLNTQQTYYQTDAKRIYYLSMEFLMGRALRNTLTNLGLLQDYDEALQHLGCELGHLEDFGIEPGLGNGGLGRLAACFLDSMATLQLPAYGYGLRYEYGIFRQELRDGCQVEEPDDWLRLPNPWEIARPEGTIRIQFGGRVQVYADNRGRLRHHWVDTQTILAVPYDTPIPGYGNNTVNTLRLWSARGTQDFDLGDFSEGDYVGAVSHKVLAENITKVLYPNDNIYSGRELRLKQQYFLVAATLHDVIRRHLTTHDSLDNLAEKAVFQLNDTHPALAIPELMRILLDDYGYEWEEGWRITTACMAYTNHTLLPEALEKWSTPLLSRLLPRHIQIINEINSRFLKIVRGKDGGDEGLVQRVSLYEEGDTQKIRMAHLAVVGSSSVNGVAELHTELLKSRVMPDFHRIWPSKFNNKTNGITQRRWLLLCNSPLAQLISEHIGDQWITQLERLSELSRYTDDATFLAKLADVKLQAKTRLTQHLQRELGIEIDSHWIFDIQIKRIHEYKRQLLNALHIVHLYLEIKKKRLRFENPRVFIFGGKAAPGYAMAKLIIRFINDIAKQVNQDPDVSKMIKILFYPNYNVTAAELLFPAADISEQISTAGYEASGTGNMKFALNGALTLGTLDGANVEIARHVGKDNIFIFGLTVDDVTSLRAKGYNPADYYDANPYIAEIVDLIRGDFFNPDSPGLYHSLIDHLMSRDDYLLFADFEAYRQAHISVDRAYSDKKRWNRMALANIANVGTFSSDRTIQQYAEDIWKVKPHPVDIQ